MASEKIPLQFCGVYFIFLRWVLVERDEINWLFGFSVFPELSMHVMKSGILYFSVLCFSFFFCLICSDVILLLERDEKLQRTARQKVKNTDFGPKN
ncbi:hypothetical protein HPP92_013890 [Vanilla planifolia]|uniref:Uncharacterized protein n=1 Tax=Vanilla planifolia TaxID=51239 RepID=A0A835QQV7_VANPL|nr:hypothetical protein HPP92_013890 [Vanilla planifolia]